MVQISTERLVLREFEETDGPALHAFESLPEVARYQSFEPRSLADSHEYVMASIEAAREDPRRVYDLAVILKAEDRLIGRCGIAVGDPDDEQAVLWYTLHPDSWGHGYATEAARALVGFGFRELGLHRIWADTDPRTSPRYASWRNWACAVRDTCAKTPVSMTPGPTRLSTPSSSGSGCDAFASSRRHHRHRRHRPCDGAAACGAPGPSQAGCQIQVLP